MAKRQQVKPAILIGIDPGIICGIAVLNTATRKFSSVQSSRLHELFELIYALQPSGIFVLIENPNTWFPFKNVAPGVAEMRRAGAGAVKQTYKHIIEFLEDNSIEYRSIRLQGNYKKVSAEWFRNQTGWDGKTNEHGRDAAMLVWGR